MRCIIGVVNSRLRNYRPSLFYAISKVKPYHLWLEDESAYYWLSRKRPNIYHRGVKMHMLTAA